MPIQLPNLDDRSYDDLVQEALSLIPTYAPEWTNHNPSDPGITLIELFAYLTEMLNYRLNRVTDANKLAFLKLINGSSWQQEKSLNEEIRDAVLNLRQPQRAVTCEDFEKLALAANDSEAVKASGQRVARTKCIGRSNLESENPLARKERPGHVSVVIVPELPSQSNQTQPTNKPQPTSGLIKAVNDYLDTRRLLTTRVHVVGPRYVDIGVHLTLYLKPDALEKDVRPRAEDALNKFLHPLQGGTEGKGWQFGRNVYVSEIYQLLDQLPGIDYVQQIGDRAELTVRNSQNPEQEDKNTDRLLKNKDGKLIAIKVKPEELVALTNKNELEFEPRES